LKALNVNDSTSPFARDRAIDNNDEHFVNVQLDMIFDSIKEFGKCRVVGSVRNAKKLLVSNRNFCGRYFSYSQQGFELLLLFSNLE
jgi:hypothetical protein